MFSQLFFQRLAGIVDQIPGFLPGLLKTQKCRVGTFTKLLVGTWRFPPTLQYLLPHPGCHPEPGRQGRCSLRTCRVLAEHDALYLRRLMHQGERRRESMRRFMTMNTLKRVQRVRVCLPRLNLMPDHRTFRQYRWRSPVQKSSKFCRDPTLPAYWHRLESRTPAFVKRRQRESRLLAKLHMAGRQTATQIVIIHRR